MNSNSIISIAPMMDWTDRHYRYFMRLITRHTVLYTEMVTTAALLHADNSDRFLAYATEEHPIVLQLGGSNPSDLATCAKRAEQHGFDAVNLNVGCPSDRVQSGRFGACLMKEPALVADCVKAMKDAVTIPITVKTRLGVDDHDSEAELISFIEQVVAAGCDELILHARKAWLKGLSPKDNRTIPPLDYERVVRMKQHFPDVNIQLNGGITDVNAIKAAHPSLDGFMLGREAYHNPYCLAEVDRDIYGDDHPIPSREAIVEAYLPYLEQQLAQGIRLSNITRHILGLFQGEPGAKYWRRSLSDHAHKPDAGLATVQAALTARNDAICTDSLDTLR